MAEVKPKSSTFFLQTFCPKKYPIFFERGASIQEYKFGEFPLKFSSHKTSYAKNNYQGKV